MRTHASHNTDDLVNPLDDPLVPEAKLLRALGIESKMGGHRWKQKGILPKPIVLNGRNYYRRSTASAVLRNALADDKGGVG